MADDKVVSISIKAQTGDAQSGLKMVTDRIREIKPASQDAQAVLEALRASNRYEIS